MTSALHPGERHRRVLRDRTPIVIRPLTPDDSALISETVAHLSPESRYKRFLTPTPRLSSSQLRRLADVDHCANEAFVALTAAGEPIGIARFARTADPAVAEVAVAVVDAWQRRGVGTALLAELATRAHELGLERFEATVLTSNDESLRLLRALGDMRRSRPECGSIDVRVTLPDTDDVDTVLDHLAHPARDPARALDGA